MSDLRTAALRALEALEYYRSGEDYQPTPASEAITSLKAALAEPDIDPVNEYRKGFIDGQIDMRDRPAEPVRAAAAKSAHDKMYSEVELANAYRKGWNDAMLRRSLGPHGIKEET